MKSTIRRGRARRDASSRDKDRGFPGQRPCLLALLVLTLAVCHPLFAQRRSRRREQTTAAVAALERLGAKLQRDDKGRTVRVTLSEGEPLQHLEKLPHLRELCIEGTGQIGQSGSHDGKPVIYAGGGGLFSADAGLDHLGKVPQLETLTIRNMFVTDAKLANLAGMTRLKTLSLGFNTGRIICYPIRVTDAGLAHLKKLAGIETLELEQITITGEGLEHLQGLVHLRRLSLSKSRLTDAGLAHVKAFARLKDLDLSYTKITDAGLAHLKGLAGLKALDLRKTGVSEQGVKRLQQALPDCRILHAHRR